MPKIPPPNGKGINVVHPGRQKNNDSLANFWKEYVDQYAVTNKIAALDVQKGMTIEELILTGDYHLDRKSIKSTLTTDGYRKASARFRKWVSRCRSKQTSITIKAETLARLKAVAYRSGFDKDDYDLMFEYMLESPEEFEAAKKMLSEMPIGLPLEDQNKLFLRYLMQEQYNLYRHVILLVDHAYFSGWHDSFRRKGRRNNDQYESDLSNFWSKTASND
jgi:hypothetical protein